MKGSPVGIKLKMSHRMDCNLDMKLDQSYSACPDEFGNASFLSSPTRLELLMTRAQSLVNQSNELSKNEMEMIQALKSTLVSCVEDMISSIETEMTKNQDLRCNTIKHVQEIIQDRFHSIKPDEDELKGFSSELQLFFHDIDTFQDCVPGHR